jgi:hypothetical protein
VEGSSALGPVPPAGTADRGRKHSAGTFALTLAAITAALALAALGASPASASSWGRPFRIAAPSSLDVIPAEIAFSTSGETAIAFGVQDADDPANSVALTAVRSASGREGSPRRVPGAQQILDLAFDGATLGMLVGTSPRGEPCCSSVQAVRSARDGALGSPRTLVGGLAGATLGRLVALPAGRLLAAIATERGVWVSQTARSGRFAIARRLTPANAQPQALAATSLPGGRSIVAWTATTGNPAVPGAQRIFISTGSLQRSPRGSRAALVVPRGHWIDELALAGGPSGPTVAWIESWYDVGGGYHSQAVAADLARTVRPRPLSPAGQLASGLVLAADARGDQALSWKACTSTGACTVDAALRPVRERFTRTLRLGIIDASQTPAMTIAPTGEALLGWIDQGHVFAAAARPAADHFGSVHTVSRTNFAADLALAFGSAGQALAAWTQGTLAQSVIGAVYRTR